MKKGGGGQKGADFERVISKQLSLWWTQDLPSPRDDIFWRTSGSGARATRRTKNKKKTAYEYGDITFTDPVGKPFIDCFLIECKRGYTQEINIFDFFEPDKNSIVFAWWRKAILEMAEAGRKNCMLIIGRDRQKILVFLSVSFVEKQIDIAGYPSFSHIELVRGGGGGLVIMKLDDFLKWVEPKDISG